MSAIREVQWRKVVTQSGCCNCQGSNEEKAHSLPIARKML